MNTLGLVGNVCGAVGMFMLALRTEDKLGRSVCFVLAALNVVVILLYLFA